MNEQEIDRQLGELLQRPDPQADPAFAERVLVAVRVEHQLALVRRGNLRRALIECGAAVAVAASFFLMSQMSGAVADGVILSGGPAMAGLVMLALWAAIALPVSREGPRLGFAA